jgi:hypothetical protein
MQNSALSIIARNSNVLSVKYYLSVIMLNVANEPFMLSVIMVSVFMLNVVAPFIILKMYS